MSQERQARANLAGEVNQLGQEGAARCRQDHPPSRPLPTLRAGEREAESVREHAAAVLNAAPLIRVEYFEIVDPEELQPVNVITGPVRIASAIWIGKTRLIDNVLVER